MRLAPLALGLLLAVGLVGCESKSPPSSYVARVGDHYLQEKDIDRMLDGMGPVPDSTVARQQVINQWIERTLLLREANHLNLAEDPEVKRQLQEQRQNTLVTAITNRIYEEMDQKPSQEEVRTYFERHQEQLTLREPYVRVRHLTTRSVDSARAARQTLLSTRESEQEAAWTEVTRRYAEHPAQAQQLAGRFLPKSRLFSQLPYVQDELANLREGELAPVIEDNNRFHLLQLVQRAPAGATPKIEWVEDKIRRRLQIRHRKQMYAREVQRLRNQAKAENLIEAPE